jgi:hypothetical protein
MRRFSIPALLLSVAIVIVYTETIPLAGSTKDQNDNSSIQSDRNDAAWSRKRYESWFRTPYSRVKQMTGNCRMGTTAGSCDYRIACAGRLTPRNVHRYRPGACDPWLGYWRREYPDDKSLGNLEGKSCQIWKPSPRTKAFDFDERVLIHDEQSGLYYFWEGY